MTWLDPDPRYPEELIERRQARRRRTLRPIHALLAGLLGVALGFFIAHATLAASRGARVPMDAGSASAADRGLPEAPTGAGASLAPAAELEQPAPSPSGASVPEHLLAVTPAPRPAVAQPAGDVAIVTPKPVVVLPPAHGATGDASYYDWRPGEAAAGPALRVGAWRGRLVTVCASSCVQVRLTDFCGCPGGRVIDLDDASFAQLAPLSRGLVRVTVTW